MTRTHHPGTRRRAHRGRRRRHRPRHHRRRGRPRRGQPRPVGAGGRRPRPGLRYVALVLQARARRAPLPRRRPGGRGPRERGRARHPHGGHRPTPHPCDGNAHPAQRRRLQAAGRRDPRRLLGGDLLRRGARTSKDTLPGRARSRRPRRSRWRRRCARPGSAGDARLGRPARGRRPAGRHGGSHRRVVRRPRPHPCPRAQRDRHLGVPAGRALSSGGDATSRSPPARSSAPPGSGPPTWSTSQAPAQPRHPPGAARRSLPGLRAAVFAPVPTRRTTSSWCCPSPTARVRRPHRRTADGPVPDVPRADGTGDRLPPRRRQRGVRASRCTAPTWWARTPGSVPCSTPRRGRDRRPVPQARHAPAAPAWSRSWAASSTTYRRMAEDAVDAAVAHAGIDAGSAGPASCRCSVRPTGHPGRARAAGAAGPEVRHRRRAGPRAARAPPLD